MVLIDAQDLPKALVELLRSEWEDKLSDPKYSDDSEFASRVKDTAKHQALQFTMNMKETDVVDASIMYQVMEAQEEGWHYSFEYNDVNELLAAVSDGKSQTFCSQINGLLTVAFPLMRSHGYQESDLQDIARLHLTSARQAVPLFRTVKGIKDPKEQEKRLKRLVNDIVDHSVSTYGDEKPEPFDIRTFEMGNGRSYVLIEVSNQVQNRALNMALRKLGEFKVSDYATIKNLFKEK